VTRLAQGPLTAETGELADPLDPDRQASDRPSSDRQAAPGGEDAEVHGHQALPPVGVVDAGVVGARSAAPRF
jgi:hypothetical protein